MPEPENTTENTEVAEDDLSATDDLGDAGKKALAEERKARRALEKQLKEATTAAEAAQGQIRQFEDRDKSEAQKVAERIAELEKQLADKDTELSRKDQDILRRDIAKDKGVPVNLVTGSTQEEMETAANAALEWRGGQVEKKPIGALRSGASAASTTDPKQQAAAALRGLTRR
jgi:septal ring factor EnvC (AmiA/AmiB activator)